MQSHGAMGPIKKKCLAALLNQLLKIGVSGVKQAGLDLIIRVRNLVPSGFLDGSVPTAPAHNHIRQISIPAGFSHFWPGGVGPKISLE